MFEDLVALAAGAPVFEGVAAALTAYLQQAGFAQGHHVFARIDGAELRETFVAGFAHVTADAGIQIMRVDLQREQAQCRQHGGVAHRHVVGGANAGGCHVAAGAPAHIGHAPLAHRALDWHDQTIFVQQLVQAPGIATADEDGISLIDGIHRVIKLMNTDGFHPQTLGEIAGAGIPVAADHGVGDQQYAFDLFAGEQGLHPIPGPTEQTRKFGGFTIAEKKQFHEACPR